MKRRLMAILLGIAMLFSEFSALPQVFSISKALAQSQEESIDAVNETDTQASEDGQESAQEENQEQPEAAEESASSQEDENAQEQEAEKAEPESSEEPEVHAEETSDIEETSDEEETDKKEEPVHQQQDDPAEKETEQASGNAEAMIATVDESDEPTAEDTEKSDEPTVEETEKSDEPTAEETDKSDEPTTEEPEKSDEPTTEDTEKSDEPTDEETDKSDEPTTEDTEKSDDPTVEETDKSDEPTTEDTEKSDDPTVEETDKPDETITEDIEKPDEPTAEETEKSDEPTTEDTEKSDEPTDEETDKPDEPTTEETEKSDEPTDEETEQSDEPTAEETEKSDEPNTEDTEKPDETITEDTEKSDEPITEDTEKSDEPIDEETEKSDEPTDEETEQPDEPTIEETEEIDEPEAELPELDVGIRSSVNHLFVGEGGVSVTATVRDGVAPFEVELRVSVDVETRCAEHFSLNDAGTAELTYYPESAGDHTATATVTDAKGRQKSVRVITAVAVHAVEYPATWEKSVSEVQLNGDWREDIVAIAQSQLGYQESSVNFIIEDGVRRGYTRYGDWYGAPYAQWCGMFVAFCQEHAGISAREYPQAAGVAAYMDAIDELDALEDADYMPQRGDLVFFMWDEEDVPSHMGIVENADGEYLYTIEGNSAAMVQRKSYPLYADEIIGYANTAALMKRAGVEEKETAKPDIELSGTAFTTKDSVNMRSQPSQEGAYVRKIRKAGTEVALLGAADQGDERWYLVKFNDAIGYVRSDLLAIAGYDDEEIVEDSASDEGEQTDDEASAEEELNFVEEEEAQIQASASLEKEEELFFDNRFMMFSPGPNTADNSDDSAYFCGIEEHAHGDGCYDEVGVLICENAEHAHSEDCTVKPEAEQEDEPEETVYYCELDEHTHEDGCYDDAANLICEVAEHAHSEECTVEPEAEQENEPEETVYYCELEEHTHGDSCYDDAANLICEAAEHTHSEDCTVEPKAEQEKEPEETVYYCELEEHAHGDSCYDDAANLICEAAEHAHSEDCTVEPEAEQENQPEETVYYCELEEHTHEDGCYDDAANLICEAAEHTHSEDCTVEPEAEQEIDPEESVYFCGLADHVHGETCYDDAANLICDQIEHAHVEECLLEPRPVRYDCGQEAHLHDDSCLNDIYALECGKVEHIHGEECIMQIDPLSAELSSDAEQFVIGESARVIVQAAITGGYGPYAVSTNIYQGETLLQSAQMTTEGNALRFFFMPELAGEYSAAITVTDADGFTAQASLPMTIGEPAPEYLCGKEEHAHGGETCVDADGDALCDLEEHAHDESCLLPPVEEPEVIELTLTPDENGMVSFSVELDPELTRTPLDIKVYKLGDAEPFYKDYDTFEGSTYEIGFAAEPGEYTAQVIRFSWTSDNTVWNYRITVLEPPTYYCGLKEHTHVGTCYDYADATVLICGETEHTHDLYCTAEPIVITLAANPDSPGLKDPVQPVYVSAQITGGVAPYTIGMRVRCETPEGKNERASENTPANAGDLPVTEHSFAFVPEFFGKHTVTVFVEDAEGRKAQAELAIDIICELEEWEESIAGVELTGDPNSDVLAIATTQIGYTARETDLEFEGEAPATEYETRYGDWYGQQREEWSTLFAAFCLHFAELTDYPTAESAQAWAQILENERYYRDADSYVPKGGDLAFVDLDGDGTIDRMAVVSSVATDENGNATDVVVIIGNHGSSVKTISYPVSGSNIIGYGTYTNIDLGAGHTPETWNVAKGPMFWIAAELKPSARPELMLFANGAARAAAVDLEKYLANSGGTFSFTLTDLDNEFLPKDEEGNYIVSPDLMYRLSMIIDAPNGIPEGTYTYQLPAGLTVVDGSGIFKLKGETVGTWSVDVNGLITFVFNEEMDKYTDVVISAAMGIEFADGSEEIEFDGNIHVSVQKPPQQQEDTKLGKWGQVLKGDGTGPARIEWEVQIQTGANSQIVGSVIKDTLVSNNHYYSDADMENGLTFTAVEKDPVTGAEDWHEWYVTKDDPNLQWTSTGWEYTIPQEIRCNWHGIETIGNENWGYWVKYTTTVNTSDTVGMVAFSNKVQIDGKSYGGWAGIDYGYPDAGVVKTGSFQGDAEGGKFYWQIDVAIPGKVENQKAIYYWSLWDEMKIVDEDNGQTGLTKNTFHLATVTATRNGTEFTVPEILDADPDKDPIAWHTWRDTDGTYNSFVTGREVIFLCLCTCTEENCGMWGDGKTDINGDGYVDRKGCNASFYENPAYCQCWNVEGRTDFTFTYVTDDPKIMDEHGGMGRYVNNNVSLNYLVPRPNAAPDGKNVGSSSDWVPIPGVFKKELNGTDDENAIASYTITVNEAKLLLTNSNSPLLIHDVMTPTLAYIAGSLVITAEDKDGKTTTLTEGVDYTVHYDGSGNQTDKNGPVHVLDITILHPAEVMYTLKYDTMIIIPENVGSGIPYSNYAEVMLFGEKFESDVAGKVFTDINIAAKNYRVQIQKYDSGTSPLPGATFGLYNEKGGLITSGTTNANGEILFQTNVSKGIVLVEHQLYYIQETKVPDGYALDGTKHWFFFCDGHENTNDCLEEEKLRAELRVILGLPEDEELDIYRIPGKDLGRIEISNKLVELSITKRVSGGADGDVFSFALALTGDKLSETYTAATFDAAGNVIAESVNPTEIGGPDYSVTIRLKQNERYVVYGLPEGTEWAVEEEDYAKYTPSISVDDAAPVNGSSATGVMGQEDIQITITNTRLYDLPSTGGTGTLLYTMGGWLLIAASIFLLYNQRMRRKEEEEG